MIPATSYTRLLPPLTTFSCFCALLACCFSHGRHYYCHIFPSMSVGGGVSLFTLICAGSQLVMRNYFSLRLQFVFLSVELLDRHFFAHPVALVSWGLLGHIVGDAISFYIGWLGRAYPLTAPCLRSRPPVCYELTCFFDTPATCCFF